MTQEWIDYFAAYRQYLRDAAEYYFILLEWKHGMNTRDGDEGSNPPPPNPPLPPKPPGS